MRGGSPTGIRLARAGRWVSPGRNRSQLIFRLFRAGSTERDRGHGASEEERERDSEGGRGREQARDIECRQVRKIGWGAGLHQACSC
jgi:hypothetical protein